MPRVAAAFRSGMWHGVVLAQGLVVHLVSMIGHHRPTFARFPLRDSADARNMPLSASLRGISRTLSTPFSLTTEGRLTQTSETPYCPFIREETDRTTFSFRRMDCTIPRNASPIASKV